jgi:hypothetical protein
MSNTKPKASNAERGTSTSVFMRRDITQINNVLQVSTVDLCGADAYLVMATPVALKHEIEQIIPMDCKISTLLSFICCKARDVFSRYPY